MSEKFNYVFNNIPPSMQDPRLWWVGTLLDIFYVWKKIPQLDGKSIYVQKVIGTKGGGV